MKKLKKDLGAVAKQVKALAKKTEKLIEAVDKLEKTQVAKKQKAKAKTTRKAPVKKKAAAKKARALMTGTDQVLKIIKRSKTGVNVPALIKRTGFEDKKIRNILMRASKQGKIKRAGRGIYVAG